MEQGKMYKLLVPLVLVSGCMTFHDQKISSVNLKSECGLDKGAMFQNTPYYLSNGKENAPIGGLSWLFGIYDKSIAQVKVQKAGNYLLAQFYDTADKEVIRAVFKSVNGIAAVREPASGIAVTDLADHLREGLIKGFPCAGLHAA
jgi:hypothetical protein